MTPSEMPPSEVNLEVLNNVCTLIYQQPFQLRDPSDTGDLLQLVEDLEKVKTGNGTRERNQRTEGRD